MRRQCHVSARHVSLTSLCRLQLQCLRSWTVRDIPLLHGAAVAFPDGANAIPRADGWCFQPHPVSIVSAPEVPFVPVIALTLVMACVWVVGVAAAAAAASAAAAHVAGFACPSTDSDYTFECATGYYSTGNSTVCTICPAGHACRTKHEIPQQCPAGTYGFTG